MGLVRNLAVAAFFAGAYVSNPDEQSFRRYVDDEMKKYSAIPAIYLCVEMGRHGWNDR
jgi:hypothetical protein